MNTDLEKLSYSLGVNIAMSLKSQGLDSMDSNIFCQAINDVLEGSDLKMSEQEAGTFLNDYFSNVKSKQHE